MIENCLKNTEMKYFLLLIPFLFPFCIFAAIEDSFVTQDSHCPQFQTIIPLKISATASNFSLVIVADGKYHLMAEREQNGSRLTQIEFIGHMPHGFEDSRLITVVDRSDCNDSDYSLIAIKSFSLSAGSTNRVQINYSALDLKNWTQHSEWSPPKSIADLPLFATKFDTFLSMNPEFPIEDYFHSFFLWEKTKTLFLIYRPLQSRAQSPNSPSFSYYSIDMNESCAQTYRYSEPENLLLALNPVISPLDFCFVSDDGSDSLLYCLSKNVFQVNIIDNEFQNGSLRTEYHELPDKLPSVSVLYPISLLCNQTELMDLPPKQLGSDVQTEDQKEIILIRIGCRSDINWFISVPDTDVPEPSEEFVWKVKEFKSSYATQPIEDTEEQKDDTIWIILIILTSFVIVLGLVFIAILVVADRKRTQLARM